MRPSATAAGDAAHWLRVVVLSGTLSPNPLGLIASAPDQLTSGTAWRRPATPAPGSAALLAFLRWHVLRRNRGYNPAEHPLPNCQRQKPAESRWRVTRIPRPECGPMACLRRSTKGRIASNPGSVPHFADQKHKGHKMLWPLCTDRGYCTFPRSQSTITASARGEMVSSLCAYSVTRPVLAVWKR